MTAKTLALAFAAIVATASGSVMAQSSTSGSMNSNSNATIGHPPGTPGGPTGSANTGTAENPSTDNKVPAAGANTRGSMNRGSATGATTGRMNRGSTAGSDTMGTGSDMSTRGTRAARGDRG